MPASSPTGRPSPIRALVLTAGLGTRLRPLTDVRAKAAVPVNGEPLIRRVVAWLASQGIRDQVLNLHHRADTIAAVVGDGSDLGTRVRYSWEPTVLGSAGGPRHALPLLCDGGLDRFLLINGDTLTDVSVPAVLEAHAASDALVTMAVIPNPRPDRYGGVAVSEDGCVTGFPRAGSPGRSFHFIGVQVASPQGFERLPDGVPAETVVALYPKLIADRPGSIRAFLSEASFRDIGTPADLLETSLALASAEGPCLTGRRVEVPPSARLTRTLLWDDVIVGRDARLTDCIVADGVRIPDGIHLERCAVIPTAGQMPRENEFVLDGLIVRRF
jgi:mannose-1-phosphate guanylyltransferase